jgi:hypothetical protein
MVEDRRPALTPKRVRGLGARTFSAKRRTQLPSESAAFGRLTNAAVAAGWPRPPGAVASGHGALELVYVADEVPLTPVECLLELFELGAPALDPVLAELDVGLELGFALLEVGFETLELSRPSVRGVVRDRLQPPLDVSRLLPHVASANDLAPKEGRKGSCLLRRDFHTEHERPGGAEFLFRHEEPHREDRPGQGSALSLG